MRARLGTTLVELVAAMTVASLVLVIANAAIGALIQVNDRVRAAASVSDSLGVSSRVLADLFANGRTGTGDTTTFAGDSTRLEMHSRCETADGWMRPCDVRLEIDVRSTAQPMVLEEGGHREALLPSRTARRFLYGQRSGGEMLWLHRWGRAADLPIAVAIVGVDDTLVFVVGVPR